MKKNLLVLAIALAVSFGAFCESKYGDMTRITKAEVRSFFHGEPRGSVWTITDHDYTMVIKKGLFETYDVTIYKGSVKVNYKCWPGYELEPILIEQAEKNYGY